MDGGSALQWCSDEFMDADLGDERLNRRLIAIGTQLLQNPEKCLSAAMTDATEVRGMGRFFCNESFDGQDILAPHYERTLERISDLNRVLVIQDSSSFSYCTRKSTKNLGHIGKVKNQQYNGILVHSSLAVSEQGESFGLVFQKFWVRESTKPTDRDACRTIPITEKESYKWLESVRETHSLFGYNNDNGPILTWVSDRESDIYEYLAELTTFNDEFVVRASGNRCVDTEQQYLWETLEAAPVEGHYSIEARGNDGATREAKLEVRFKTFDLQPPRRKGRARIEQQPSPKIQVTGILVREVASLSIDPKQAVEWCLLTNTAIDGIQSVMRVIDWYIQRWHIECWHKTIKSGFSVEKSRLNDGKKLIKFLALASVLATRIYRLAHLSRQHPERPCTEVLTDLEWMVLYMKSTKSSKLPNKVPNIKEATTWIARLGGFRGTYKDPGQIVFWRGWQELQLLTEGVSIASKVIWQEHVSYS